MIRVENLNFYEPSLLDEIGIIKEEVYASFLLDERWIEITCNSEDVSLKRLLKEAKKYCYIPVKDIDDLRNQIKEPNFLSIERVSQWKNSSIPVLNHNGNIHNFGYCHADYNIVNKWRHKRFYKCFQIIYSDDFTVGWYGDKIDKPLFWVSIDKTIYGITYLHKRLWLYPSACVEPESVSSLDTVLLDNIVNKYEKRFSNNYPTNDSQIIDLDQCFKKGFFYKGPKYDFKNRLPYYDYISEIKNAEAENGLIRIEIENITYPHSGYAYLDLAKLGITYTEVIES